MTHTYTITLPDAMSPVPGHILIPLVDREFQQEFSDPHLFVTKSATSIIRITHAPHLPKRYERALIRIRPDPLHATQSYAYLACMVTYQYRSIWSFILPTWRPLTFSDRGSSDRAYVLNFLRAYLSDFMGVSFSNIADRLNAKIYMAGDIQPWQSARPEDVHKK